MLLLVMPKFYNLSKFMSDGLFATWEMVEVLLSTSTLSWLLSEVLADFVEDTSQAFLNFEKLEEKVRIKSL